MGNTSWRRREDDKEASALRSLSEARNNLCPHSIHKSGSDHLSALLFSRRWRDAHASILSVSRRARSDSKVGWLKRSHTIMFRRHM